VTSLSLTSRRSFVVSATAMSLLPLLAEGAPAPTTVRIGVLVPPALISPEEGMREGLMELGYINGKNITMERRLGETTDALQSGAADLARSKVDVIVAFGTAAASAALSVTPTIPVVFISGDPVSAGLASSLGRPGANATGVSTLSTELIPKRLELLRQVAPRMRQVILLGNPSNALHAGVLRAAEKGAQALHVHIIAVDARNADELNTVLEGIQRRAADAFIVSSDVLFLANKEKIAAAVAKAKLPGIFPVRDYHDAGVLMSYGASLKEMGRQMAVYVDKILKGAKPGELPIEQISKYELVIDLRATHALGLRVPQDLLLRADEVIRRQAAEAPEEA
jgi:putative tryptophan/tyrosine transport system substrate-binding protein